MSERVPGLYAGLLAAFALKLAWDAFGAAAFPGLVALALLALIVLSAAAMGRIALRAFRVRDLSESEKTLIGTTIGLGALSQAVFLLAALGILKVWAVVTLLGACWVVGWTEMADVIRSLGANRNLLRDRPLAAVGLLAAFALLLWFACVPPHQYDALVYHLPLAEAYAREGRLVRVDHLLFTHFPQNAEMLYSLAILLGSDTLAQMLTWSTAFLSAWWVFEMGKREIPASAALGACLMLATHTAVMLLAPTAYVECVVMLWITAAVLSFLRWHERARPEDSPRGWLALSGIFAGLGVGTKYYAGITPILLTVFLVARWARSRTARGEERLNAGERLRDAAVFAACAAAAGAPWLIKNWIMVGNPVFPFFYRQLPPRGVAWTAQSARRYFEILTEYGLHQGDFLGDLLRFPLRAASGSMRFGGGADVLGDFGWALSVAAGPAALWAARKNRYLRWAAAYCVAHWAIWYCTGVVLRFLVVLVPLWSLLCAHGLFRLWERASPRGRALGAVGVGVFLATNLGLFLFVHSVTDDFAVLTGEKPRGQFLAGLLDYYPCARQARETLPEEAKLLVLGDQRGYYLGRRHVATTVMAPNEFVRMADKSFSAQDLGRRLRMEGGFTHILWVPREAQRLEPYGIFHFTREGQERWNQFMNERTSVLFEVPGRCKLFGIHE